MSATSSATHTDKRKAEPKPKARRRGRPTIYTPELVTDICVRLAGGESLRAICRDGSMPAESTVRGWVKDDREGFPAQYARARDIGLDAMADELLAIADDGSNDTYKTDDGKVIVDHDHIQRSRLRVDTRKWLLSKMAPKRYGDRQHLEMTGAGDGPIQHEDMSKRELGRRIAFALHLAAKEADTEA